MCDGDVSKRALNKDGDVVVRDLQLGGLHSKESLIDGIPIIGELGSHTDSSHKNRNSDVGKHTCSYDVLSVVESEGLVVRLQS